MTRTLTLPDHNLILAGYTGPNQPMIGREVAQRLDMPYVNVEIRLEERAGTTIDQVRALYGEARLKTLESEVVEEALLYRGAVIRIGGQTLLHADHYARLRETGPVICLVATLDAVLQRLHLAMGARYHNPHERAVAIGHLKREWSARQLEGIHELDTTYLTQAETVDAVIALWQREVVSQY